MVLLRRSMLFTFFLVLIVPHVYGQDQKSVELVKLLEDMELYHNVKFSYIEDDLKKLTLYPPEITLPLKAKLTYIANRTGINYREVNTYIAIYIDIKLKVPKICGYITDEANEQIPEATIGFGNGQSMLTGPDGYFELPAQTGKIKVTHLAFEPIVLNTSDFTDDCKKITLTTNIQQLEEVVTERYLTTGISKKKDGSFIINPKKFGILPGLIEPDVLLAMQQLPGINSIDETVSNINVRGGTHDQNLFMWNGIRLFQTGHFFGLISALNPNLANDIKISKNGSSAFYGESVSSTVDISSRTKNIEGTTTIIGSNMINAEFYTRIKASENANFELSARRSFTDVVDLPTYSKYSKRIFQNTVVTQLNNSSDVNYRGDKEFFFYDFTAQYHQKIAGTHDLYVDLLGINNDLDFTEGTITSTNVVTRYNSLQQITYGGSIALQSKWDEETSTNISAYRSFYDVNALNESIGVNQATGQKNKIRDMGMNISGAAVVSPVFTLHGGYQYNAITIENYDAVNTPYFPKNTNEGIATQALIGELEYNSKNSRLYTRGGVRLNYIDEPATIYTEPRLQFNYKLSGTLNLEILAERKSQTASQIVELQNDFLGIEKRRWVLANGENIPIQKSSQFSAGVTFRDQGWLLSIDNFYKKVDGITTKAQSFQDQLEVVDATGSYTVTGSEFLVQKQFDGFYAWLSYTWNNNDYTFRGIEPVPSSFPSSFEISHTVNSAAIYEFKKFKIALGSKWYTGRPVTNPINNEAFTANEETGINYAVPNSDNLNNFFQVNFSASYLLKFGSKSSLQLGVSVLNIFNRQNIINRYYRVNSSNNIEVVNTYSLERTPNALIKFSF